MGRFFFELNFLSVNSLYRKEGLLVEEKLLVNLAKNGDKKAIESLLQQNYSILKGYLLKITLNSFLADDLTQETMLRAILNIRKYEPKAKFSTWLITIATNLYKDYLRKAKRLVYSDKYNEQIQHGKNLEEAVIEKIEFQKVKFILEKLPEEKRSVFILKHYYGYSYEEISQIEGCPIGTVRSRLYYCIRNIQQLMKGGEQSE